MPVHDWNPRNFKHGHAGKFTRTLTYRSWNSMRQRCLNPNHKWWPSYGGRGISICARWNDFNCFLADMGEKPLGMSLERKNNDGNYEPSNCKWVSAKEQANNTRQTRVISYNGRELSLAEWARVAGIDRRTLKGRLDIMCWSIDRALTEPVQRSRYNRLSAP